jgi:hypothetical protein
MWLTLGIVFDFINSIPSCDWCSGHGFMPREATQRPLPTSPTSPTTVTPLILRYHNRPRPPPYPVEPDPIDFDVERDLIEFEDSVFLPLSVNNLIDVGGQPPMFILQHVALIPSPRYLGSERCRRRHIHGDILSSAPIHLRVVKKIKFLVKVVGRAEDFG